MLSVCRIRRQLGCFTLGCPSEGLREGQDTEYGMRGIFCESMDKKRIPCWTWIAEPALNQAEREGTFAKSDRSRQR